MQDDPRYKMARRVRSREARLRAFLNVCGAKRVDEESGGLQPAYRIDGITIRAEFPKPKGDKGDDDMDLGDNIERKQVYFPCLYPASSSGSSSASESSELTCQLVYNL